MCDDSDQFSLRWNNFHSNLATGFHALLQGEDLVDVTLAAGGKFIQAHKIVLSVCSPYFKELFKVNPCKHPIVILKDVYYKELVAILQFMYKGEVNVRQEELATFLKTAEMLQVKGLTGDETPASESPPPMPLGPIPTVTENKVKTKSAPPTHSSSLSKTPPHTTESKSSNPSTSLVDDVQSVKSLKRRRSTSPKPSPSAISNVHSEDSSPVTVEHIEISRPPKTEPPDYDSDLDSNDLSVGNSSHHTSENLSHLLSSESSQQKIEIGKSGSHLFAAIPGLSHDTLSSHESGVQAMQPIYHCVQCHKVFKSKYSLRAHLANIHEDKRGPVRCPLCNKLSKNQRSLATHVIEIHGLSSRILREPISPATAAAAAAVAAFSASTASTTGAAMAASVLKAELLVSNAQAASSNSDNDNEPNEEN